MSENLKIYNNLREVPKEAQKQIAGGKLKGFTDINPMWRIKALTEQFGPCGIGWKVVITDKRIIEGNNGEKAAFVDIDLYYKVDGQWSEAVPGTGGSGFVNKEKGGLVTSDECFKMALTDAMSVAMKFLGGGADIYWNKDRTKYDIDTTEPAPKGQTVTCARCHKQADLDHSFQARDDKTGELVMLCERCAQEVGII